MNTGALRCILLLGFILVSVADLQCLLCSEIAEFILTSNFSVDINETGDLFCNVLPKNDRLACYKRVEELANAIQKLDNTLRLQEELDGEAVCTMFNECTLDCCISDNPEQVHISYLDDPHTMVGTVKTYTKNAWLGWIHNVKLTNLVPGTQYFYQVGSDPSRSDGWSAIFSFTTEAVDSQNRMFRFAEIGDMGADPEAVNTIKFLADLSDQKMIDFIIHNGDVSYADGYQHRWDVYLREMEPIIANMPYMTTVGNHEIGVIGLLNFSIGYIERFMMPGPHGISQDLSNMYYSFNYGNIHFVALDTENIFDTAEMTLEQAAWLDQDLSSVNRKEFPWVIVYGHRNFYCSNGNQEKLDTDCGYYGNYLRNSVEKILNKYKVDLVLTAHKHNYERMWPIKPGSIPVKTYVNPGAPVYIVNGAGGNREGTSKAHRENSDFSVKFLSEWGVMIFTSYNSTVMDVEYYSSDTRELRDSFTLVVDH